MTLPGLANDLRIACQRVSRRVRFESTDELAPHLVSALSHLLKGSRTPGELAELERQKFTRLQNIVTLQNTADQLAVQVNERIAGAAVTDLTTFDGIISGPNESGLFTHAGVTREFRLVDNVVYSRQPPTAKWQVVPTLSSYLIVAPLFNVTNS